MPSASCSLRAPICRHSVKFGADNSSRRNSEKARELARTARACLAAFARREIQFGPPMFRDVKHDLLGLKDAAKNTRESRFLYFFLVFLYFDHSLSTPTNDNDGV